MPTPGEPKTVQARILAYTEAALPGQFRHLHGLFCLLLHELMTANTRVHELNVPAA